MSTRRRPDAFAAALALASFGASAADRQSLDEAWWTGPLLAAGAATLPQGRVLVEPYVFDVIGADGDRTHSYRSLTYLLYGVTDRLTAGIIPVSHGDLTVQAQYRLSQFREGGWTPTTSVVVQHTYRMTTVALRSQYYWWMPNGRIMRTRFHVSYAAGATRDVSAVNSSLEYSVTRNWVLALDLVYQHDDNEDSESAWRFGVAPAIEYNWNSNVGVIVGARRFVAGRNSTATVTPMVAINLLF
jgi:hypothetical protein